MLSVLIPTYNVVCLSLVEKVYNQAVGLGIPFEILVADDASCENVRKQNCKITEWQGCHYLQLDENVGPASIRNYLAAKAHYPNLLFLDSDTMPVKDDFLAKYMEVASGENVVCGGFIYVRQEPPGECALRYYYGIEVEELSAEKRNLHPYHRFIGMNFLVGRRVFDKVRFDDTMHFGYEDAYFGKTLSLSGIAVSHIDNPVYHFNADTSEQYLMKIRRSISNVSEHISKMESHVRLLQWYAQLRKYRLVSVVAFIFRVNEKRLIRNLTSPNPSLKFFAFYKLGYLCTLMSPKKSF